MAEDAPEGQGSFLLWFDPEVWSPLDRLRHLTGPPFPERGPYVDGLFMARAHFAKYEVLSGLANRLAPELSKEDEEMKRRGFTSAIRSREFAALTETLVCELYSVLGGLRLLLCGAFPRARLPGKTSLLFKNAANGKVGSYLPGGIRALLAAGYDSWFPLLRSFRSTVVHRDAGSVHLLAETGCIRYVHSGFMEGPRPFVSEDIVSWINERHSLVRTLVDQVADFLCSALLPAERRVPCGVHQARFYERIVVVGSNLTRQSGRCASREWFDLEPARQCPLQTSCEAYRVTAPQDEASPGS